ncbi:MAG: L-serine ammonia-lyase [Synergistaceae bacterium]|jgi:L-serine dehydratase|nr:L-serine ammonia-lyase [Synergistaceae bacterium]
MLSVFDIFKIGVGPSSSHTVGPMKAGRMFVEELRDKGRLTSVTRVRVDVYGSLSLTGKGHNTDMAIIMGLAGNSPDTVDIDAIPTFLAEVARTERLPLQAGSVAREVDFARDGGFCYHNENLPLHENGMEIHAFAGEKEVYFNTYYSVGGGFIVDAEHFAQEGSDDASRQAPYPFAFGSELLAHCEKTGLSISALMLKNEEVMHERAEIDKYFNAVWDVMRTTMERGMNIEGMLPGGLNIMRRAKLLRHLLESTDRYTNDPMKVIDWVNLFALAMSEENSVGGRVVTAPTNGSCGVIPAVLAYYDRFVAPLTTESLVRFFMAAGAVGLLYKMNASFSGAEVGCQGEVGVACSMAAAGLTELMGGSPIQVTGAAEIAMEHNLGLTCDPVGGLVQAPCIERNAIAAVKAINASRMALRRVNPPRVPLDVIIETMYQTGKDMNAKYRETSTGGLAVTLRCE